MEPSVFGLKVQPTTSRCFQLPSLHVTELGVLKVKVFPLFQPPNVTLDALFRPLMSIVMAPIEVLELNANDMYNVHCLQYIIYQAFNHNIYTLKHY